ncbi:carboxylesterase family protein [Jiangella aurantiaca]|uniref:Carboxylic ester hydrolase n=2 Tax=Jiangella aurantiaca TaxID=2530373 RepID=A0A4R5AEN5_9ACTN|nr:carboxylesterase family protein [Jiangella aurantiaca]
MRTLTQALVSAAVVAGTLVASAAAAAPPDPGLVRVDSGWLRGSVAGDHVTYSGIPYAAPPVGKRRWRPPARPQPWPGVRDATAPSPFCPQGGGPGVIVGQEDCLYLDVTVPRGAERGERLPVLVWLHGGGFSVGGAREYDGARLATAGDVVVVTVNYRLGALGFLSAPSLDVAGGNYGLMDQAAALRWVRRNAARFGGDPSNVTLAGQSAGARSVCAQLASPETRGLFHRAIMQSGACDNPVPTLAEAQAFGERATAELGCADAADVAGCLRDLPAARVVDALAGVGREVTARVADRPWNPVAGTPPLPRQPGGALSDGSAARVPLLIGTTRDEMRAFIAGEAVTADGYRTVLAETFGADAPAVLAEYPAGAYETPAVALATVLGDWGGFVGVCPVLSSADAAAVHQPVYAYEFAEDSGVVEQDFPMGAFHGLDLPYLWDLHASWDPYPPLTPAQERLSATMVGFWTAFARTGDPNGPGRPHWPEFGASRTVLGLSAGGIGPTPSAAEHHCDLWSALPR